MIFIFTWISAFVMGCVPSLGLIAGNLILSKGTETPVNQLVTAALIIAVPVAYMLIALKSKAITEAIYLPSVPVTLLGTGDVKALLTVSALSTVITFVVKKYTQIDNAYWFLFLVAFSSAFIVFLQSIALLFFSGKIIAFFGIPTEFP
jgi:hypothetical protein